MSPRTALKGVLSHAGFIYLSNIWLGLAVLNFTALLTYWGNYKATLDIFRKALMDISDFQ